MVEVVAKVGKVSNTITVTINNNATNISINGGNFTTNNGIASTLTATILPTNHSEGNLVWTSSDTSKLTINSNTGDYSTIAPRDGSSDSQNRQYLQYHHRNYQ